MNWRSYIFSVLNIINYVMPPVVAINKIQSAYGLSRVSWQGDPCVPREFLWAGLNCNNTDTSTPPTITSL